MKLSSKRARQSGIDGANRETVAVVEAAIRARGGAPFTPTGDSNSSSLANVRGEQHGEQ
ncbi:hypothetical protein RBB50_004024 [Rhinocladiella similis]